MNFVTKKAAILSLCVLCIIIAVSVIIVSAEDVDYDALALAEGYVCRIGDSETAYDEGKFSGYYRFFTAADLYYDGTTSALESAKSGEEITLIDDIRTHRKKVSQAGTFHDGSITTLDIGGSSKDIVINGNGYTYKAMFSFRAITNTLTVKNLNFVLLRGSIENFADVRQGGTINFENCTFTSESPVDRSQYGYFMLYIKDEEKTTNLNFNNCTVKLAEGTTTAGYLINFVGNMNNCRVYCNNFTADFYKSAPKVGAFKLAGGELIIEGDSYIHSGRMLLDSVPNNPGADMFVTIGGNTQLLYTPEAARADKYIPISAYGNNQYSFYFTMKDNAKLYSTYECFGVNHDTQACKLASITIEDNAEVIHEPPPFKLASVPSEPLREYILKTTPRLPQHLFYSALTRPTTTLRSTSQL